MSEKLGWNRAGTYRMCLTPKGRMSFGAGFFIFPASNQTLKMISQMNFGRSVLKICIYYPLCTVTAVQEAQALVIEGLCTHAHAVDGELRQSSNKGNGDVVRITFNGYFGPR